MAKRQNNTFVVLIFLINIAHFNLISKQIRFLRDGFSMKYDRIEQKCGTVATRRVQNSTQIRRTRYAVTHAGEAPDTRKYTPGAAGARLRRPQRRPGVGSAPPAGREAMPLAEGIEEWAMEHVGAFLAARPYN